MSHAGKPVTRIAENFSNAAVTAQRSHDAKSPIIEREQALAANTINNILRQYAGLVRRELRSGRRIDRISCAGG